MGLKLHIYLLFPSLQLPQCDRHGTINVSKGKVALHLCCTYCIVTRTGQLKMQFTTTAAI